MLSRHENAAQGDHREGERYTADRSDANRRKPRPKRQGLRHANLPFTAFAANEVWRELVLIALDLAAWTQAILLRGTNLATAERKTLRYRLLHVAGRITRHGRQIALSIPTAWPWREELVDATRRLAALPAP